MLLEDQLEQARSVLVESLPWARPVGSWAHDYWLELAGEVEVLAGSYVRAARLFGATNSESLRTGPPYQAQMPRGHDAALAAARAALGEEGFAQAWAEGQAMTLDQAVEYALEARVSA